ncbi:MAG: SufD family Fe-S cluster assembly protein [Sphingobium sp.]|nr:SufD family Fe-S cluster assembly protein [Sphingobium sp.]
MNALASLPTRKDEAWRYSNLDAAARVWPGDEPDRFIIAAGEHVHRAILQDAASGDVAIRDLVVEIGAGGSFGLHLLDMGGVLGRITLDVTLHEGAHFELEAALLGDGEQTIELVTRVTHAEPDATSSQTVRAIAAGKATTSYLGQVRVARDAQKTDASQSFKAMLLDRGATANAKPELEIFADDVKCAHGASIGELDAQALFYLASRGLDPARARTLMLQAFIAGLFDDMADEAERTRFEGAALAKLEAMG